MQRHITVWIITVLVLATAPPAHAQVTDEQVERTIASMKAYLYSKQNKDGSWEPKTPIEGHNHKGGTTGLMVLSLLLAGDSSQEPRLNKAIAWLDNEEMAGRSVYVLSLRAHVWAQLRREYLGRLRSDTQDLLDIANSHPDKLFRYTAEFQGPTDLSVEQYGLLAVWEAAKREVPVPNAFWRHHLAHVLKVQNDDGGWGYADYRPQSSGTMTCAGLTALYIVQQQAMHLDRSPDPAVTQAIERGLKWFEDNFDSSKNPGYGWDGFEHFYYLYSIERVGMAGGIRTFRGVDWYESIAQVIVRHAMETGHVPPGPRLTTTEINTAFALMFLARGRYPVMILKLRVPGVRWNERPNDIHFLSQFLSDDREAELNWQVVDADTDPSDWITSPILYFASPDAINLTDTQKQSLKRYIDLGGTLVCAPDNASREFLDSARKLAAELYPEYPLRPLRSDDPIFEARDAGKRQDLPDIQVVSNGTRNLLYLATTDWSYEFQAGRNQGESAPWKVMTNIWASATNRGKLPGRLTKFGVPRMHRDTVRQVTIHRGRYPGQWDPEHAAWEMGSNVVWNRDGVDVNVEPVDLEKLGEAPGRLTHLAGIDKVEFTTEQLDGIDKYIRAGGVLLIENVGGMGEFSRDAARQIGKRISAFEGPLPPSHPILTGKGIEGGYDNSKTTLRPYAQLKFNLSQPRMSTIFYRGKPAAIISHEDISLGVLGSRQWHVVGYDSESARRVLTNIVLWAAGEAEKAAPAPK